MMWNDRIDLNPEVLVGKPVIKGTRIAVEFLVDLLAQGWPESEVLRNYPGLTHEDILACLSYASAVLRAEKVYPVPVSE
jgi:uncharacterized protein (DUF433 family)